MLKYNVLFLRIFLMNDERTDILLYNKHRLKDDRTIRTCGVTIK